MVRDGAADALLAPLWRAESAVDWDRAAAAARIVEASQAMRRGCLFAAVACGSAFSTLAAISIMPEAFGSPAPSVALGAGASLALARVASLKAHRPLGRIEAADIRSIFSVCLWWMQMGIMAPMAGVGLAVAAVGFEGGRGFWMSAAASAGAAAGLAVVALGSLRRQGAIALAKAGEAWMASLGLAGEEAVLADVLERDIERSDAEWKALEAVGSVESEGWAWLDRMAARAFAPLAAMISARGWGRAQAGRRLGQPERAGLGWRLAPGLMRSSLERSGIEGHLPGAAASKRSAGAWL